VVGVLGWNSPGEVRTLRQLVVDRAPAQDALSQALARH
jgi:hypothetical protein